MATQRPTKETLYLRRDFTPEERLEMGRDLAQAHNRLAAIDDEEKSMKATIKERRTGVELAVGSLSRRLNDGYEMENQVCVLTYDEPNVGEVTYRNPVGAIVKVRPMSVTERQMELPLATEQPPTTEAATEASVEKSTAAVDEFFGTQERTAADQPEPIDAEFSEVGEEADEEQAEDGTDDDDEPLEEDNGTPREPLTVAEAKPAEPLPDNFEDGVRKAFGAPEPFSGKPRLVDARPGRDKDSTGKPRGKK